MRWVPMRRWPAMTETATERAALALFEELIDVRESDRASWIAARTDDAAVKARLAAMVAADRISSLGTGAAALAALGPAPDQVGAYRITGLVGRGGMGAVYRATRDTGDFALDVAIKIIKPGLLSEQLAARLAAERQTLAGMNHPNIARLFDGGTLDDGAPYIIMELIDGQPADRWGQDKDTRERVNLLITAARAVAHAHQRLIIHRDITPANVLVTPDGTLKLIDFGIARTADAATTTATDVHGLGRLAARLLPDADAELAAIITRATHADPDARYPTADALADDLGAWQDGRVVTAMPGGRTYALRKFIGRHRLGVSAAAGTLLLLLAALTAVLIAGRQARNAEAEASARFTQTRAVARALLFPVYDEIAKVSGSTAAKAELARTGLAYLDALAAMPDAPPDVRVEAARGYVRLAEVTGGARGAALGLADVAPKLLAKAETLLAPAMKAQPASRDSAIAIATLRLEQANSDLYNSNEPKRALPRATQAEQTIRPWARGDGEAAMLMVLALKSIGDAHSWNDDFVAARRYQAAAQAFAASLPPPIRDDDRVQGARSASLRLLGEAQHKLGEVANARASIDAAIAVNRELVRRQPDHPERLRKLAASLWYAAVVHRTNNRTAAAQTAIAEALAITRRLTARDPRDAGALQMFTTVAEIEAQLRADAGDDAGNQAIFAELRGAHDRMIALGGDAPGPRRSLATVLHTPRTYDAGEARKWSKFNDRFARRLRQFGFYYWLSATRIPLYYNGLSRRIPKR
jgi:eukaryotic-like serine/threonine-protein kinase